MKNIFLIVSIVISVSPLRAQNPGYMGMKFSAGYNFHFYFGGLEKSARPYDVLYHSFEPNFFLNKVNEFHADYVLAKNYSIGVSVDIFKTGQYYYEDEYYQNDFTNEFKSYKTDNYLNISGSSVNISNKFFFYKNGTGLAPNGNYAQLNIGRVSAKSVARVKGESQDQNGRHTISQTVTHAKTSSLIISGGLGNQSILFDRLILDIGLELAFLPGSVKGYFTDFYETNTNSDFPKEINARNAVLTRLQTFYISSVKVGVGVLLF